VPRAVEHLCSTAIAPESRTACANNLFDIGVGQTNALDVDLLPAAKFVMLAHGRANKLYGLTAYNRQWCRVWYMSRRNNNSVPAVISDHQVPPARPSP
jgi:hypothetical protein